MTVSAYRVARGGGNEKFLNLDGGKHCIIATPSAVEER